MLVRNTQANRYQCQLIKEQKDLKINKNKYKLVDLKKKNGQCTKILQLIGI